ncbi:hypothetical protein TpMuguga_04g00841 [Theileria parva strain Muguga]|uniref:Uncharacterized protein n=1 Tax=Theileria parva TaxID=5875 RepID=Q4N1A5_THEPA|nr:uncharacterized protein TpMuguga_04g00841 [Theileria parva strain Muguga]EAN32195.1 hypothetical protein TpMuguga_04g00841 [Theileria parva strain Muguga]|eukprot:XP_764478.1 hypothetical protein [Theileria parva strain Muguga]
MNHIKDLKSEEEIERDKMNRLMKEVNELLEKITKLDTKINEHQKCKSDIEREIVLQKQMIDDKILLEKECEDDSMVIFST